MLHYRVERTAETAEILPTVEGAPILVDLVGLILLAERSYPGAMRQARASDPQGLRCGRSGF